MLYLIFAICSSAMVSICMRISGTKVKNNTAMLCINYFMCLVLSWVDSGFPALFPKQPGLGIALGLGTVNGLLYLGGFVLLQRSIQRNGVVLSSTFMKLGLMVSILVSILFFGEMPSVLQWLGCGLAIGAIVLMNGGEGKAGNVLFLLALMGANGMADAMSKFYEQWGAVGLSGHFLLYTFAAALLCCLVITIRSGEGLPGRWEIGFGLLIGIPNFYSAKFLLGALGQISAVVAYPVASVGTILAVTLAGVFLFRERLSKGQWLALGLILAALTLLNL